MEAFNILTKPKRVFIFMWTFSCFLFFSSLWREKLWMSHPYFGRKLITQFREHWYSGWNKTCTAICGSSVLPRETFTGSSNTSSFLFSTYCTTSNASLTIWDLNRTDDDIILCFASKVLNLLIDLKWGWILHIAHFKNKLLAIYKIIYKITYASVSRFRNHIKV